MTLRDLYNKTQENILDLPIVTPAEYIDMQDGGLKKGYCLVESISELPIQIVKGKYLCIGEEIKS